MAVPMKLANATCRMEDACVRSPVLCMPSSRKQTSSGSSCALTSARPHWPAWQRRGVHAPLEDRLAGHQRHLVAVDPLNEAPTAGGHVLNKFGPMEPQPVEIDQVHIGTQAGHKSSAVGKAE